MIASKLQDRFSHANIVELLGRRASDLPDQMAYRLARFGETADEVVDYRRLDAGARCIANRLKAKRPDIAGERVLICMGFGLDFITAFFGCLYAGAVAVPAYPPRQNRLSARLRAIAADAAPTVVLTTSPLLDAVRAQFEDGLLDGLAWILADSADSEGAGSWVEPRLLQDDVAYLQYTSGSTANPKGVMVTHRNVLHNARLLNEHFRSSAASHAVSWLPLYHDMGLIGAVFQPLLGGYAATLLTPASFLQKPLRWLEAISRYRATISGGPNFAYDLCTRSISPQQRDSLDLSSWENACCGAEPIRAETMERFAEHFRPCGFRASSLHPCYGLAEATLIVTGGVPGSPHRVRSFTSSSLTEHVAVPSGSNAADGRRLVSCGSPLEGIEMRIVDPETRAPLEDGAVGEIWVNSPSVAGGYWGRMDETESTFRATLRDGDDGVFLRTGDLGFVWEKNLYVTGRRKELIIINGRNFYPQDIEYTVASCHDALRGGTGSAFPIDDGTDERLVVVHELSPNCRAPNTDEILASVRQAVWDEHELKPHAIVLVKRFGVPRTTSGKIQRFACRDGYHSRTLPVIAAWTAQAEAAAEPGPSARAPRRDNGAVTAAAIRNRLIRRTSELLNVKPRDVDSRVPFSQFGLDSIKAVGLSAEFEDWIGFRLPPTLLWDYPTIDLLADYLASLARGTEGRPADAAAKGAPYGGAIDENASR